MNIREGLTYDDVLLVPQHNAVVEHRDADVDLSVQLYPSHLFQHPLIPANMSTVTGGDMAEAQVFSGGLALIHRFMPIGDQLHAWRKAVGDNGKYGRGDAGCSLGVKDEDRENFRMLHNAGVRIFCIDIAHADSKAAVEMIKFIKHLRSDSLVIAGNVATRDGAKRLWQAGAEVVKVGVGPGSLCTTRIETGNGVPQLTAIMDVHALREDAFPGKGIIADGGINAAGDCVKALCFSDMVMIGRLFAGCDEAGDVDSSELTGKSYVGSSTHKTSHIEGVKSIVPRSGLYRFVLAKLLGGITSGCAYQGVNRVKDLQINPEMVRISHAGLRESYPHDVQVISTKE